MHNRHTETDDKNHITFNYIHAETDHFDHNSSCQCWNWLFWTQYTLDMLKTTILTTTYPINTETDYFGLKTYQPCWNWAEQLDPMTETKFPIGMWPNGILSKIGMRPNILVASEWDRITFWEKSEGDRIIYLPQSERDQIILSYRKETKFWEIHSLTEGTFPISFLLLGAMSIFPRKIYSSVL
jgi:hypothetical protein